jgi:ABC-type phosphate transport system substrate-binding protein
MRRAILSLAVLGVLCAAGMPSAAAADYKVVVNAANPVDSIAVSRLERLFLKKDTRWENGETVEPVDQSVKTAVRSVFTSEVHGKDVGAVKCYWQKQVFSGRGTPPPEMSSDAEVLAFVRSHPGAVGYVSSGAAVGDGVRTVTLTK